MTACVTNPRVFARHAIGVFVTHAKRGTIRLPATVASAVTCGEGALGVQINSVGNAVKAIMRAMAIVLDVSMAARTVRGMPMKGRTSAMLVLKDTICRAASVTVARQIVLHVHHQMIVLAARTNIIYRMDHVINVQLSVLHVARHQCAPNVRLDTCRVGPAIRRLVFASHVLRPAHAQSVKLDTTCQGAHV